MKNQNLKDLLGMCLNWKGFLVVGVIGASLFFFLSPEKAVAFLPFLLLAVCPLSMMFGIRMMGKNDSPPDNKGAEGPNFFTCPMHQKILKNKAGTCPVCGMNLIPK